MKFLKYIIQTIKLLQKQKYKCNTVASLPLTQGQQRGPQSKMQNKPNANNKDTRVTSMMSSMVYSLQIQSTQYNPTQQHHYRL